MEKKIFVPDMHCENCVRRISDALSKAEISFKINLSDKTVTIEGCEHCQKTAMSEIYDLGFTPEKA